MTAPVVSFRDLTRTHRPPLQCPRLRILPHTLVAPALHSLYSPSRADGLAAQLFTLVWAADEPLSVAELATQAQVPVPIAMVVVTDLIQEHRLVPCTPVVADSGLGALERVREHLSGRYRTVETAHLLVASPYSEPAPQMQAFLGHVGPVRPHEAGNHAVVHARRRLTDDLQLAVTGVHGAGPLRTLWPDVSRHATAALLVVTDQALSAGRESAALISEHPEVPLMVVVHLTGDEDLDAPQVSSALDLTEEVPVVMVDATDSTSLATVVSDLCHHIPAARMKGAQ